MMLVMPTFRDMIAFIRPHSFITPVRFRRGVTQKCLVFASIYLCYEPTWTTHQVQETFICRYRLAQIAYICQSVAKTTPTMAPLGCPVIATRVLFWFF